MISIITVNYNGIVNTRNLLKSLFDNISGIEYEIIVVDNASKEDEANLLKKEFPQIKAIRSDDNLGFSGGNNLGVKHSSGDFLLFLNNDVIVESNFITSLLDLFERESGVGIVSPKILTLDGRLYYGGCKPIGRFLLRISYIYGDLSNALCCSQKVSLAHGAALIIRKDILDKIGGWPDIYFLYHEEIELSLRVVKMGYSVWYEPNSVVYHLGGQSTGAGSSLVCYYITRNRLLLYKRNLKGIVKWISILYQILLNICYSFNLFISGKLTHSKAVFEGSKDFIMGHFFKK